MSAIRPKRRVSIPSDDLASKPLLADPALPAFDVPELCRGSALGYTADGMQRLIPKARPGTFDEEEFVVGMRFVVL